MNLTYRTQKITLPSNQALVAQLVKASHLLPLLIVWSWVQISPGAPYIILSLDDVAASGNRPHDQSARGEGRSDALTN